MPKKVFKGRPSGSKNRQRAALPTEDALRELKSRTTQTVSMTAKILATTEGAVRREMAAGNLPYIEMGRLRFIPSAVILRRITPVEAGHV
jgi:hypothetical protein